MDLKDKRLVERMDTTEQEKYYHEISKHIPDAGDKYEEIEIEHEPINLLAKLKDKSGEKPEAPFSLEPSDQTDET